MFLLLTIFLYSRIDYEQYLTLAEFVLLLMLVEFIAMVVGMIGEAYRRFKRKG